VTADTNSAVAESLVGRCIDGRYQLEAEIGVGGLGSVYRALHTKLQRPVAVKLLHESCGSDVLQRRRFEREAKALAALEHSNIVAILDYGVSENRPYLVMELLEGETLAQRVKRGPIPLKPALSIAQQLLEALSFMHSAGLVHRDVKPSNVFLQRLPNGRERVKVLDFGLAKFTAPTTAGSDPTLTRDGTIVGTPAYMSPEQATGDMVDARGDVYAAGVIIFQMLSGHLPFEGDAIQLIRSHLVATVPTLDRLRPDSKLDAALDALIQRSMAKSREERFADAAEMLRVLLAIAPISLAPQPPDHDVNSGALAEVDPLTGELVIALDDSNDVPTAVRAARPKPGFFARSRAKLRTAVRRVLLAGVRVVAGVSMVLVLATVAIFALLFRSDADRADLVALQQRVSDRLVERSFRTSGPSKALQPQAAKQAQGSGALLVPHEPSGAESSNATNRDAGAPFAPSIGATDTTVPAEAQPVDNAAVPLANPAADLQASDAAAPAKIVSAMAPDSLPPTAADDNASAAPDPVPGPPAARNPWLQAVPRELRLLRKLVASGGRAGERAALALRTYNQQHADDPRGHLLLGQLYLNRLWRPDALAQFATALQLDLSVRGAPEVLPGLVDLVVQGKVAGQAERLLVKTYGSEALANVDAALANQKDPAVIARLRALRTRLGS
jgi:serine/threonine protein kinase